MVKQEKKIRCLNPETLVTYRIDPNNSGVTHEYVLLFPPQLDSCLKKPGVIKSPIKPRWDDPKILFVRVKRKVTDEVKGKDVHGHNFKKTKNKMKNFSFSDGICMKMKRSKKLYSSKCKASHRKRGKKKKRPYYSKYFNYNNYFWRVKTSLMSLIKSSKHKNRKTQKQISFNVNKVSKLGNLKNINKKKNKKKRQVAFNNKENKKKQQSPDNNKENKQANKTRNEREFAIRKKWWWQSKEDIQKGEKPEKILLRVVSNERKEILEPKETVIDFKKVKNRSAQNTFLYKSPKNFNRHKKKSLKKT